MKNIRNISCAIMIGLVVVTQLAYPVVVSADGEIPPAPTDTLVVDSTPPALDTPTDTVPTETLITEPASPTDTPVETSTPLPSIADPEEIVTMEPIEETIVPADINPPASEPSIATPEVKASSNDDATKSPTATAESTISSADTVEATTNAVVAEPATLLEAVDEVVADTGIVVLDENGQPVSLVTQEAAQIIESSDPMWCPVAATTVTADCVYAPTVSLLLPLLAGKDEDGIIYFFTPTIYNTDDVTFDGFFNADIDQLADNNLTLQGGWDGNTTPTNPINLSGNSTFSVPIKVLYWNGDVTINDIIVDGATGVGLGIQTSGNVSISDSATMNTHPGLIGGSNQWGDGADIFAGGNVTIDNSDFTDSDWDGIFGYANSFNISNSNFTGNGKNGSGAGINVSVQKNVTFTGTNFNNTFADLRITCRGGRFLGLDFPGSETLNAIVRSPLCGNPNLPGNLVPKTGKSNPIYQGGGYLAPLSGSAVSFYLNCTNQPSFTVNLPNGDKVEIICPVRGQVDIKRLDNTILPGKLPAGYTYASAFQLDISRIKEPLEKVDGEYKMEPVDVITEGGFIKVSFVSPASQLGKSYAILFWDNKTNEWIPLKDFAFGRSFPLFPGDPGDERNIASGVFFNSVLSPQRVEALTNFPGIFVLAEQ